MYPFKMKPVFKDNIWGGTRLRDEYKKDTPYEITGESWEVASHKNGESKVCGGEYNNKTIKELTKILKNKFLGDKVYTADDAKFPLLVKFIDARDDLSVQVHPDDKFALENENGELGKTEMWYIMDASTDAGILYGFKEEISKQAFENSIKNNTILEYTKFEKCQKGDSFFIPAGTLHAIGKGLLIAEIQQNSDTTYRIYDYDRRDFEGNPRELHIDKAVKVTNLKPALKYAYEGNVISDCEYFRVEKLELCGNAGWIVDKNRFEIIIVCEGALTINGSEFVKGETALIPAYIGKIELEGEGVILRSFVNV